MNNLSKIILMLFAIFNMEAELRAQNQNTIDSLLKIIKTTDIDTVKVNALNKLSKTFFYIDPQRIKIYAEQGIDLAKKINYSRGIADCTNNLGLYYYSQQDFVKSLKLHLAALGIYDSIGYFKGSAIAYLNIGIINYSQGNFDNSIEYFTKALNVFSELKDYQKVADCYNNIGAAYSDTKKYLKSIECYTNSIKIYEEIEDVEGLAGCYNNIASIYNFLENRALALKFFDKAIELYKKINFTTGIAESLFNISEVYGDMKDYEKSNEYANKSLEYSKKINSLELQSYANQRLAMNYQMQNDFKKALDYFQIYNKLKDSVFNIEKTRQIGNIEAKYQNNKKQQEIENQAAEIEKKSLELKVQKTQKYLIFIGFILMIIVAGFSIYNYFIKKKANNLLSLKNLEIENQKEKINAQKDEIEKQRDTVIQVNKELNNTNIQMTDSIKYAKLIQMAILPSINELQKIFPESFIFFQPRDIVSGDFYWFSQHESKIFIALVDCTGHGVPGAFMSMIGNTLLNQIVNEKEIYNPSEILYNLHKGVLFALSQRTDSVQEDGMDVSLCIVDKEKNEICLCSTKQSAYIIINSDFKEVEGNKVSIGSKNREVTLNDFEICLFNIEKDTSLYLSTDGYYDQFGGESNKKFSSTRFTKLLQSISKLPATEQKEIIEKTYNEWKNSYKQIDDVTVIGLKLTR